MPIVRGGGPPGRDVSPTVSIRIGEQLSMRRMDLRRMLPGPAPHTVGVANYGAQRAGWEHHLCVGHLKWRREDAPGGSSTS